MAEGSTTRFQAGGVLFTCRADDPRNLVDAAGRQPMIVVTSRLRPAVSPISADKLTPFLGVWGQLDAGENPQVFVVKVIAVPADQAVVPPAAARLLANEEEAARRNHLLLPDVPATGMGGGYAWVVRRYINGLTLAQVRDRNSLQGNEVLLARLVLEALVELHARTYHGHPLFHGDIKPANVIVTAERATVTGVELIDFESGGSTGDAGPVHRHATLEFASPEHFLSPVIDQASDVFSWGLTVLAMYAPHSHPFVDRARTNDPEAFREAYGSGRRADGQLLGSITDPALQACVRDALTVRSDLRPTARDLFDRLAAAHPVAPPATATVPVPTTTFELPREEGVTRVASTAVLTGAMPTPLPAARPTAPMPVETADPDSVPAQLSGWWQQVFTARGYLGAADFGPWHWLAYLVAAVCAGTIAGMVLGVLLLSLGRLLFP